MARHSYDRKGFDPKKKTAKSDATAYSQGFDMNRTVGGSGGDGGRYGKDRPPANRGTGDGKTLRDTPRDKALAKKLCKELGVGIV